MVCIVMACIVMACIGMACVVTACKVMTYIVMACVVMACVFMASCAGSPNSSDLSSIETRMFRCTTARTFRTKNKKRGAQNSGARLIRWCHRRETCATWEIYKHIGSISALPTACPLCGYGRASTQNHRLAEMVILSTGMPIPAQRTRRRRCRDRAGIWCFTA